MESQVSIERCELFVCNKCQQSCNITVTNYAIGSGWGSDDWRVIYKFRKVCDCEHRSVSKGIVGTTSNIL